MSYQQLKDWLFLRTFAQHIFKPACLNKNNIPSNTEIDAYLELLEKIIKKKIEIKGVLLYGVERPSLLPEASGKIEKLSEDWLIELGNKIQSIGLSVKVSV